MNHLTKRNLIGGALVLVLGAVAAAPAVHLQGPLARDAFKAAQQRIEQQAKVERKACDRLKGDAKDSCQAQAKVHQQIAEARLDAQRKPSLEGDKLARFKAADAAFRAAKARCEVQPKGLPRDQCLAAAKSTHDGAIRLAKVEKVQQENAMKARAAEVKKDLVKAHDARAQELHQAAARPPAPKS
jgi:hypothetical protein